MAQLEAIADAVDHNNAVALPNLNNVASCVPAIALKCSAFDIEVAACHVWSSYKELSSRRLTIYKVTEGRHVLQFDFNAGQRPPVHQYWPSFSDAICICHFAVEAIAHEFQNLLRCHRTASRDALQTRAQRGSNRCQSKLGNVLFTRTGE